MSRSGRATIVAAVGLVSGLCGAPALSETAFDGKWQGTYVIVEDYGTFNCEGGDVFMEIKGARVAIETRNDRSSWEFQGAIDAGGKLRASGDVGTDFSDPNVTGRSRPSGPATPSAMRFRASSTS